MVIKKSPKKNIDKDIPGRNKLVPMNLGNRDLNLKKYLKEKYG